MKKVLVALLVLLTVAGIGGSIYLFVKNNQVIKEKEVLIQKNSELQYAIDAIGPVTTAFTVVGEVGVGNVIKEEDLVEITIPQSSVNDTTVLSISDIVGKLYKVDIQPGTTMTKNLVMSEEFTEAIYEQDMTFSYLPLGLTEADYIDIRLTLPYGETFYVMSHKRVEKVFIESNTIKVWLTAAEQALWKSCMKDVALHTDQGIELFVTKYVEPGVNLGVSSFYPIRLEMEAPTNLNVNITDKKQCINTVLREQIEIMITNVEEEDGSKSANGVSKEASEINNSKDAVYNTTEDNSQEINQDDLEAVDSTEVGNMSGMDDIIDLNEAASGLEEGLEELGDINDLNNSEETEGINSIDKTDGEGNTSNVTEEDKDDVGGEPIFSDETVIE